MNVEKILHWADYIATLPHVSLDTEDYDGVRGFNLAKGVFDCGTPACIAAHVVVGARPDIRLAGMLWLSIKLSAAGELELDSKQAQELFAPFALNPDVWEAVTPAQAAACMRHLAATGVVDWPRALKECHTNG